MKLILSALSPIIIGAVFAFLMNPMVVRMESWMKKKNMRHGIMRAISIVTVLLVIFLVVFLTVELLVPRLTFSLVKLTEDLPGLVQKKTAEMEAWIENNERFGVFLHGAWEKLYERINKWVSTDLTETVISVLKGAVNAVGAIYGAVSAVLNILIGLIVMVYILAAKESFVGQFKKILYAFCKNRKYAENILEVGRHTVQIFNGFLSGKLLDSIIVGILCLIVLSIMRMPFYLVISVIVGITNIIPVFGPFIGAIPSAILVLLVSPMKALEFLIFILILQQIDGQIIGPRILGDSTGISAFWVMFSILLFGKLFGVAGMIVGVPTFASFYYVVKRITESRLCKQNLPTDTEAYVTVDYIDWENKIHYLGEREAKKAIGSGFSIQGMKDGVIRLIGKIRKKDPEGLPEKKDDKE